MQPDQELQETFDFCNQGYITNYWIKLLDGPNTYFLHNIQIKSLKQCDSLDFFQIVSLTVEVFLW